MLSVIKAEIYAMKHIIIVGAGMGGLSAAINLYQKGFKVTLVEASDQLGGLARSEQFGDTQFDAGPYILLDQPGLQWAYNKLGYSLENELELHKLTNIYTVNEDVTFYDGLEKTIAHFEKKWPTQGEKYRNFVLDTAKIHTALSPHTYTSKPTPWDIIKTGKLSLIPFLVSSLGGVLARYSLHVDLQKAIGIWTQVAAQTIAKAPAPMALVPSLMHGQGAYYPIGGMGTIPQSLANKAIELGVTIHTNTQLTRVVHSNKKITAIETNNRGTIPCDVLMSNMSALAMYELIPEAIPKKYTQYLQNLPLQSPGIAAYLQVKTKKNANSSYLTFNTKHPMLKSIAFVNPGVVLGTKEYHQARLVAPLDYNDAKRMTDTEQVKLLDDIINSMWWKEDIEDFKVLYKRTSNDWGKKYNLYKNSMNPVMTASFMRKGRMPHKSKYMDNLYFCGSSTHPGQWVSFAAISGILSSDLIAKQYG